MLIDLHPKVASLKSHPSCSKYGEIGHAARAKIHSDQNLQSDSNNSDEFIIKSMLLTS